MPTPRVRPQFRTGRVEEKPKRRKPMGPRPRLVVDEDALAAVKAQFERERIEAEQKRERRASGSGRSLPVTGACHDCGRPVGGERRFCGPCLASH